MMRHLSAVARRALEVVYPPQCVACEGGTDAPFCLCPACWGQMPFITRPYCARLGTPFAVDFGAAMLSPAAIADPPRFDAARAVALHDGVARELVSRFKYGERLDLARFMAPLMVQAGQDVLKGASLLVPVPMHPRRLLSRRYNQAALLANAIGERTGIPVNLDALMRRRNTPQQVGLNRAARRSNLAAAFRLKPGAEMVFSGAHVVLIDDVRTTGATLNACAHLLRKGGASRIDVLTFTLVPEQGIIG
jgi:ComF family protein